MRDALIVLTLSAIVLLPKFAELYAVKRSK